MDKPRSDVAYNAAVQCLQRQDFKNLPVDSRLDAPVCFAFVMGEVRKEHAAACDAAITTPKKIDFFKVSPCFYTVSILFSPSSANLFCDLILSASFLQMLFTYEALISNTG